MGGLVGGIFDLASGDPTQGEEQGLQSLSGYENNLGEQSTSQGLGFESAILSGDPTKIAEVEAPEIKAGQDQVQQQAEQNALFGNRGGGTNSSTNAAQAGQRANIINLTGQLQQGAASALTGAGENLLGQGASNLNSEAGLASANRQRLDSDVGNIAQGAAQIATGFMDPAAAAGGASPFSAPQLPNFDPAQGDVFSAANGPEPEGNPDLSVFGNS